MSLRDDVLDKIAGYLPDTPENIAFCEGEFSDMLDGVMQIFKEYVDSLFEEE